MWHPYPDVEFFHVLIQEKYVQVCQEDVSLKAIDVKTIKTIDAIDATK